MSAFLLDAVLQLVTLYIGWIIWTAIVAERSQTPGKQILGMYVMWADGTRSGGAFVYFIRESLIKGLLFGFVILFVTLGIAWILAALWCLWDRNTQCLWDKVGGTYVAHSPRGFRPLTANEMIEDLRIAQPPPRVRKSHCGCKRAVAGATRRPAGAA